MHILKKILYPFAFLNYILSAFILIGMLLGFELSLMDILPLLIVSLIIPAMGLLYFILALVEAKFTGKSLERKLYYLLSSALFNAVIFYTVVYG